MQWSAVESGCMNSICPGGGAVAPHMSWSHMSLMTPLRMRPSLCFCVSRETQEPLACPSLDNHNLSMMDLPTGVLGSWGASGRDATLGLFSAGGGASVSVFSLDDDCTSCSSEQQRMTHDITNSQTKNKRKLTSWQIFWFSSEPSGIFSNGFSSSLFS